LTVSRKVWGGDSLPFSVDEGFAEGVDHGADEEVAAELEGVGLAGLGADDGDAAAEWLEERAGEGDGGLGAGDDDPEAALFRDAGAAEDGGGEELLGAAGVLGREALTEGDADGGVGDVERAGAHGAEHAIGAEQDLLVGGIVKEHG